MDAYAFDLQEIKKERCSLFMCLHFLFFNLSSWYCHLYAIHHYKCQIFGIGTCSSYCQTFAMKPMHNTTLIHHLFYNIWSWFWSGFVYTTNRYMENLRYLNVLLYMDKRRHECKYEIIEYKDQMFNYFNDYPRIIKQFKKNYN